MSPPEPRLRSRCAAAADRPIAAVLAAETDQRWFAAAARALDDLPDVHGALVCLDPIELPRLTERAARRSADLSVIAPSEALESFLSDADVVLLPPGDPDTLPPHLALCLAAGVPVVCADDEQTRTALRDLDFGETCDVADHRDLAEAVRTAIERDHPVEAARRRARLRTPTPWPPLGRSPIRLGLGTANYAGQLAELARAVSWYRSDATAEVVAAETGKAYRFPADRHFPAHEQARADFQLARRRRVLGDYTHLVLDALQPAFGWLNGDDAAGDLPELREAGIGVALLMHGSEVRDPDAHLARHEFSPYRDAGDDVVERLRERTARHRRIAAESGAALFVTTPDLLDDVPGATWLPLTVDVDRLYCGRPVMERARPVVLHAPSARWTKGSAAVLPVLRRLHEAGAIEFRLVEGVAHERLTELVRDADIVVDQLSIGSYGAFACEAMAAGRPVIAYLHSSTAERMGARPPVVNATQATFEAAVASLLDDRERTRELGRASLRFARRFHGGREAAARLGAFLKPAA